MVDSLIETEQMKIVDVNIAEADVKIVVLYRRSAGQPTASQRLRLLALQILCLLGCDLVLKVGNLLFVLGDLNADLKQCVLVHWTTVTAA